MQEQASVRLMWIDVEVIDPRCVEGRGSTNQPVDLVSLVQQQFGEIRAVLSGDSGNERSLHWIPASVAACPSPHDRHFIIAALTPARYKGQGVAVAS